ncbi:MAG: sporulation protein YtfJ [Clostridiales bacterium]|jgi:sporulation protein YtfJ|nr:sporulation protein YtfJ [Clostridiales bacterium]
MDKHPIGDLMEVTMGKIRDMIDVNTVVGQPITTPDGITLIPVSKLSFGFGSGGGDFVSKNQTPGTSNPFAGGSGAGVNIVPVAFLVIKDTNVRLVSIAPPANTTIDRVIELVPEVLDKVQEMIGKEKEK